METAELTITHKGVVLARPNQPMPRLRVETDIVSNEAEGRRIVAASLERPHRFGVLCRVTLPQQVESVNFLIYVNVRRDGKLARIAVAQSKLNPAKFQIVGNRSHSASRWGIVYTGRGTPHYSPHETWRSYAELMVDCFAHLELQDPVANGTKVFEMDHHEAAMIASSASTSSEAPNLYASVDSPPVLEPDDDEFSAAGGRGGGGGFHGGGGFRGGVHVGGGGDFRGGAGMHVGGGVHVGVGGFHGGVGAHIGVGARVGAPHVWNSHGLVGAHAWHPNAGLRWGFNGGFGRRGYGLWRGRYWTPSLYYFGATPFWFYEGLWFSNYQNWLLAQQLAAARRFETEREMKEALLQYAAPVGTLPPSIDAFRQATPEQMQLYAQSAPISQPYGQSYGQPPPPPPYQPYVQSMAAPPQIEGSAKLVDPALMNRLAQDHRVPAGSCFVIETKTAGNNEVSERVLAWNSGVGEAMAIHYGGRRHAAAHVWHVAHNDALAKAARFDAKQHFPSEERLLAALVKHFQLDPKKRLDPKRMV